QWFRPGSRNLAGNTSLRQRRFARSRASIEWLSVDSQIEASKPEYTTGKQQGIGCRSIRNQSQGSDRGFRQRRTRHFADGGTDRIASATTVAAHICAWPELRSSEHGPNTPHQCKSTPTSCFGN